MKKILLILLAIILIVPALASGEAYYLDGDFLPNDALKDIKLQDCTNDSFAMATLAVCVGMSLNEDSETGNDINMLDITNIYRVGVTKDYAVVVFEAGSMCGLVCYAPGYAESYYFFTDYENIDVINSSASKMCSSLTQINMQDMADIIRFILKSY